MKKTLVAMAALAVAGGAFAQSTVTLFGRVDATAVVFDQKLNGTKTADNNVGLQLAPGNAFGLTGSRWGLRGSEDLGGGLNAIFMLESGFAPDNGRTMQGTNTVGQIRIFGRQAYAGLSGGFGSFTFGRQYSPLDGVWGAFDAQGYSTNSPMTYVLQNGPKNTWGGSAPVVGVHMDTGRIDNSFMYTTPNMGGFTGMFMYAPGENKNGTISQSAGSYMSASGTYMNGPLGLGVAYERTRATKGAAAASFAPGVFSAATGVTAAPVLTPASAAATAAITDFTVAAQYDFGPAKAYALYERATSNNTAGVVFPTFDVNGLGPQNAAGTDKGWVLGVAVPMGAFTFSTSYARETTNAKGVGISGVNKAFGLQGQYDLSKRTSLYATYLNGESDNAAKTSKIKNTLYGAGMIVRF